MKGEDAAASEYSGDEELKKKVYRTVVKVKNRRRGAVTGEVG